MFWLTRPPLLRYLAAALLVAAGFAIELWPQATVRHPFTTRDVPAGATIDHDSVEYRLVPEGLFSTIEVPATAVSDISEGEPLTPSMLGSAGAAVPQGWLSIEMTVPNRSRPGMPVVVVTGSGERVEGVVVEVQPADDFTGITGLVALHPDGAQVVARAVLARDAAVLLGH